MPRTLLLALVVLAVSSPVAVAESTDRHVRLGDVALYEGLPPDLSDPEGKSRWDLTGVAVIGTHDERVIAEETGSRRWERTDDVGDPLRSLRWSDPAGGDAAERWLLPHRFGETLRPGAHQTLDLVEARGDRVERVSIRISTVGIGWVHLPDRPHEVALQRALVMRQLPSGRGYYADRLVHRWVDPRSGVVAEISGPASGDGREREGIDGVTVVEQVFAGVEPLRLYLPEVEKGPFGTLTIRRDRVSVPADGVDVVDLVANNTGVTTIMDLVGLGLWDFNIAANRTGTPIAQTSVLVDDFETCNVGQSGYFTGMTMGRRDRNYGTTSLLTSNQVVEIVLGDEGNAATDPAMVWMRAGRQNEGTPGAFGSGETGFAYTDRKVCNGDSSVFCRDDQDCVDAGTTGPCNQVCENDTSVTCSSDADCPSNTACVATDVPLWRFPHFDGEWYMELGDPAWQSDPFDCEQNFVNGECGAGGFGSALFSKDCGAYAGTQSGEILAEGVATLPSGHTVNALVVRTLAELCVYPFEGCGLFPTEVRTAVYLWQVPHLSTVVLLQSDQNVPDENTIVNFPEAQLATDLFPPITIQTGSETDTTIDVSWVPGNATLGVDDYVVYWDTDSGSVSDYGNSVVVPSGQTSTTLTGLAPGTQYFITVTARSDFTPYPPPPFCRLDYTIACANDTECADDGPCVLSLPPSVLYESIRFPTTVSGDPDIVYPIEVMATTTGGGCIPTEEVNNLMVGKIGTDQQFCWDANTESCTVGYDLLWAATPDPPGPMTVVAQTGLETCWTGNPQFGYFKVVARGTGGSGP